MMVSPSGIKMKKEVTQNDFIDENGVQRTIFNVKWKPVSPEFNPIEDKKLDNSPHNRRESLTQNPIINRISVRKPEEIPQNLNHYKIEQSKDDLEKSHPNPYNNHQDYQNKLDLSCPIEDPRNPFHQEYLKLKALYDGKLVNGKEYKKNYNPPQPKIVIKKIESQEKLEEIKKKKSESSEKDGWIRVKDPEIIEQYFKKKPERGEEGPKIANRTIKKEYPNPSAKSINRPPTIVIETPISDSDTPTKVNDYKKPTKLLNQYHYCQECDVAFQPILNNRHQNHDYRGFLQQMPDFDDDYQTTNYEFFDEEENKNNNMSPYRPQIYSPDENLVNNNEYFRGNEENRNYSNFNTGNYCGATAAPQLVKGKKKPFFGC